MQWTSDRLSRPSLNQQLPLSLAHKGNGPVQYRQLAHNLHLATISTPKGQPEFCLHPYSSLLQYRAHLRLRATSRALHLEHLGDRPIFGHGLAEPETTAAGRLPYRTKVRGKGCS